MFATRWCLNALAEKAKFHETEGLSGLYKVVSIPNSRSMLRSSTKFIGTGLKKRVYSVWFAYSILPGATPETDEYVIAFNNADLCPFKKKVNEINAAVLEHPLASVCVKGESKGIFRFTPLSKNVCRVTFVGSGSVGGNIPVFVMNSRVIATLKGLDSMRERFERNGRDVDEETRGNFTDNLALATVGELKIVERSIYDTCMELEKEAPGLQWSPIGSRNGAVEIETRRPVASLHGQRPLSTCRARCTIDW